MIALAVVSFLLTSGSANEISPTPDEWQNDNNECYLPCTEFCYVHGDVSRLAGLDCENLPHGTDRRCQVRDCAACGLIGKACACHGPGGCPKKCHTTRDGEAIAIRECASNVYCILNGCPRPCKVAGCIDDGLPGFECRCPQYINPLPCPKLYYVSEEEAARKCSDPLNCPCEDEDCGVRSCITCSNGTGYHCVCGEVSPSPEPDSEEEV